MRKSTFLALLLQTSFAALRARCFAASSSASFLSPGTSPGPRGAIAPPALPPQIQKFAAVVLAALAFPAVLTATVAVLGDRPRAAAGAPSALSSPAITRRAVQAGVAVELAMAAVDPAALGRPLQQGDEVSVRFTLTDIGSGTPLLRAAPGAWIDPRRRGEPAGEDACRAKASAIVSGGLTSRAEVDLTASQVLTLNADASISVIDPRFGFGGERLLSMVLLRSPGADWALPADGGALFVSMPASDKVAVVSTSTFQVAAEIDAGARPMRLALQPDESYLWVTSGDGVPAERSTVTVIAARDPGHRVAARIALGAGAHDIAFSDDSRTAFVTNKAAGTVSVIDVPSLTVAREIPTGRSPGRVAFSRIARAAYVTDALDGSVTVLDAERREVVTRIATEPGVAGIAFDRKGRFGFAWNPDKDELAIVDAAQNRVVQTGHMDKGPDQVTFSDTLAYVRHSGTDTVLMIPLDQIGTLDKPIAVADFPGGERAPGKAPLSDTIVQAAGETAVLVANAADKAVYFYKEGMAAPMGSFQGYGHVPTAVKLLDRGLRPRGPGVYETTARLASAGPQDVVFFLDAPRLAVCFPLDVAESGGPAAAGGTRVESLLGDTPVPAGKQVDLRVRLTSADTRSPRDGLADVRMLAVLPPGVWHTREPAEALGEGVYSFRFTPPSPGIYDVRLESQTLGLSFQTSPHVLVRVEPEGAKQ